MVDRDEKVMAMVQRTLNRKPGTPSRELYEKAKKINNNIGKMTLRQFHARYPLQLKSLRRKASKTKQKRAAVKGTANPGRAPRRSRRTASGGRVPAFVQKQLDKKLDELVETIRGDFSSVVKKDSLQEADAFLARVDRLEDRWKRAS